MLILKSDGSLEYISDATFCTQEQAKELFDAWMNHKSACMLGEDRYAILSWEIYQLAGRNVKGKGAIVGAKTKTDYGI